MPHALKPLLKRGALVTAANWPVVVALFVADSLMKTLLLVPAAGGVLLVVLLVGGDPSDLLGTSPSQGLPAMAQVLLAHSGALVAFLLSVLLVLAGGALLMVLAKGGAVAVLIAGERAAGSIEEPPLRLSAIQRAAAFSLERFTRGSEALFAAYVRLGLVLALVYAVTMLGYLTLVFGPGPAIADWPVLAGAASLGLIAWFTIVNFIYLQFQIVMGATGCGVRAAAPPVWRLLTRDARAMWTTFGAILIMVLLAAAGSILATAALGLIGFVPLVGLAVLPLQFVAWVVRGLVFQLIDLTALVAYLHVFRAGTEVVAATGESTASVP
ncbi:MAG: hypothetical protein AB7O67_22155 [Vicinamibacterales bacterium]